MKQDQVTLIKKKKKMEQDQVMYSKEIDPNSHRELTPPSLRILDMISMYSTMLCAVSMKKQVTTASQTPAITIKIPLTMTFKMKKTMTKLTS